MIGSIAADGPGGIAGLALIGPKYFSTRASAAGGSKSPAIVEDRVVGRVVRGEELAHVVEGGGVEVRHGADRRVVVRVALRVDELLELLVPGPVGLVVDRQAPLVLHHLALVVELLLGHRRRAGCRADPTRATGRAPARGWGPSRSSWSDRARWWRSASRRSTGAARSARPWPRAPSPGTSCARTGARSRSCPASRAAADVVPQVHGHDRRAVVARQDDAQPVRQAVAVDRYVWQSGRRLPR